MKKRFILVLIVGIALGIIIKQTLQTIYYKKVEGYPIIGEIVILNDYVNVREQATTRAKKLYTATINEKYKVVEIFEEEVAIYTWYKIVFSDRRVGWVASLNANPWVKELGKPDEPSKEVK